MPNIAIVIDSTTDMPADWPGWQRVTVVPIHIQFDDASFREGIDIDEVTFFRRVDAEGAIPKTSQPSPTEFADVYRRLAASHDAILSIHIGDKLSGTYHSAALASDIVADEISVYPFDSNSGSIGTGFMVMEALELLDQGKSPEEALQRLAVMRTGMNIFLTPKTLKYVQLSGRIGALGAAVASLLDVKPIIVLRDGQLFAEERVRTRKRALNRIVDMMQARLEGYPARVGVIHSQSPETAKVLRDLAVQALNCDQIVIASLSTSVSAHLGPGTVGIVTYPL
jgi:DegV family protein with EDD domain